MTRSPHRQPGKLGRKAQVPAVTVDVDGVRHQAAKVDTAPAVSNLDEQLALELVQGLVRSATARGADPVARLQEFRTLQQTVVAMSQDSIVAQSAERLVHATDLTLQEMLTAK